MAEKEETTEETAPQEEEETEETEPTSAKEDDGIGKALKELKKSTSESKEEEEDEEEPGEVLSEEELDRRYRYHQKQAKAYRIAKSKGREPIEATQERLKSRETEMQNRERMLEVKEHLIRAGIPAKASGLVDINSYKFEGTSLKESKKMVEDVQTVLRDLSPTRVDAKQPGRQSGKTKGKDIFDDIAEQLRG